MVKSSKYILFLILAAFFFRGVFLVAVFPIFKGQDESRHYNTVQYLSTGKGVDYQNTTKDKDGKTIYENNQQDKQDLSTYRYSDEIKKTALITQHKQVRGAYYDKVNFKQGVEGYGEVKFKDEQYSKIQHVYPPDVAGSSFGKDGFSLYQWSLSGVEKLLSPQNIFVRYSVLRIISVLLGVVLLLLAYNIFRGVQFTERQSLILTAIISFQPKLVTYFTNINYDVLLIPLWTGFIFLGTLILKKGWNFSRALVLVGLLAGAIMTKPSALPLLGLLVFLIGRVLYQKIKKQKFKSIHWIVISLGMIVVTWTSYLLLKKVGLTSLFSERYLSTLGDYLNASLSKIDGSSSDYWGAIRWQANNFTSIYVQIIWIIEWVAWSGIVFLITSTAFSKLFKETLAKLQWKFFRKLVVGHHEEKGTSRGFLATIVTKIMRKSESYLRRLDKTIKQNNKQRIYLWFMLAAIIVLQIGIRVADWKVFMSEGNLALGTPGRYWLPNIIPHFVLLALGLKVVMAGFSKRKIMQRRYFEWSLLGFLVLMMLYWTYEVVDIIIPRFYL